MAREFWINDNRLIDSSGLPFVAQEGELRKFKGIHVIEHSAYQQLQEQLAKCEEALRFYADENRYHYTYELMEKVHSDGGKRAREYFKKEKV